MRTIAIINQKGGCGKTTTAINLAALLARRGGRVLLVDMDPQSHCAAGLGIPEQRIDLDVGDAMLAAGVRTIDHARLLWRAGHNLDLAPSRMRLAGLEAPRGGLAEATDKESRLATAMGALARDYEFCCIDCPPAIGLLTYNALGAADAVLIPVETGYFALQGATRQVNTVKSIARRLGRALPVWLLPTIHDEENSVAADVLAELTRRFKERVCPVVIRRDASLREAASFGQAVADYAPDSRGAADYGALAAWVLAALREPNAAGEGQAEPELHVAEVGLAGDATSAAAPAPGPEVKPVSRAEDVARRAQEFLRRVAMGRGPTTDSPAAAVPEASTLRLSPAPPVDAAEPSPVVKRLFGARVTSQGVLFVQPLTAGQTVAVAGDFNHWSPSAHTLRRNADLGVFEACLALPPGRHLYRLVIDGQWTADPYNDTTEPNPFGDINSIVEVGVRAGAPA